ncbi:MAG: hypothetical protein WC275_01920 [Bacilli bacterium]
MARKNKTLIGFLVGALLVGGLGFLSSGYSKWNPDDWRDKIIPSVNTSVDEDETTSELITEDPVIDSSSEDEVSIEEPTSEEAINPVMELPEMNMTEDMFNFSFSTTTGGLSAASYKNSSGELNGLPVSYNSLRLVNNDGTYDLRFGFPGTTSEIHTDTEFSTEYTYTSYLKYDFKFHNKYYGFVIKKAVLIHLRLAYRTNLDTEWSYLDTNEEIVFNADNKYYQFALVYNINNKSSNITSRVDFENIPLVILEENEVFRTINRNIYVYNTEDIFSNRHDFVVDNDTNYHNYFRWDEPNGLFFIQAKRPIAETGEFNNFKTYGGSHLYLVFNSNELRSEFRNNITSINVNNIANARTISDMEINVLIDKENNFFDYRPALRFVILSTDPSDVTLNIHRRERAAINTNDILVDEIGEYVLDTVNGWKNYLEA